MLMHIMYLDKLQHYCPMYKYLKPLFYLKTVVYVYYVLHILFLDQYPSHSIPRRQLQSRIALELFM